jgi:hypothetical protein
MAGLTLYEIEAIRSDLLADDIEIPSDARDECRWSLQDAMRYFESGGLIAPPPGQLRTVAAVLAEAGVAESIGNLLAGEVLSDWVDRLSVSRREQLRRLKVCGLTLSDRQAIVNTLARAWREARIPPQPSVDLALSPPPPPATLWAEVLEVIRRLRLLPRKQLDYDLRLLSHAQSTAEDLSGALRKPALLSAKEAEMLTDSSVSETDIARAWSADALGDVLEAVSGWSFDRVRLLKEGCGLSEGVHRPRLGQPIAFWTNQLGERGTEVALFDYADFSERCLGATAWVLHPCAYFACVATKFRQRFGERVVQVGWGDVGVFLAERGIQHLYIIKEGTAFVPDVRALPRSVSTLIHCVFHAKHPHGDRYAKISACVDGTAPVVPHIVRPRDPCGPNLRAELGIPATATVFGRHGGLDTFSIDFARSAVLKVARQRRDIFFVFLNTHPLDGEQHENIVYLKRTSDEEYLSRFIRSCDAMLHARSGGETFGLAVAEFSAHNRPVFTSSVHDDDGHGRMHLDALGAGLGSSRRRKFFYHSHDQLVQLLTNFDRTQNAPSEDFNAHRAFAPTEVMATFERVFLAHSDSDDLDGGRATTMSRDLSRVAIDGQWVSDSAFSVGSQ